MILNLAWKNIWRNKLRSFIIIGAISIGLFTGTFMSAFMTGWIHYKIIDDINNELSYIQIHQKQFSQNNEISAYFFKDSLSGLNRRLKHISGVSHRIKISGMIASAANASGVIINGVDVDDEKKASLLYQSIPDSLGEFLPDGKMQIVVSRRTAEHLKVKLKSKVVISFQDIHGEVVSAAFRIGGIFKTANSVFDESTVFVKESDLFPLTGLPEGAVHEAAIMLDDFNAYDSATAAAKQLYPNMDIKNWAELMPSSAFTYDWTNMISAIFIGIFLFALAFGIINTMLMAVLERQQEIGMLMCIGMNKRKVFQMIMSETLFLTLVGAVIGIISAVITIALTAKSGIDLTFMLQDQFEDFGYSSIVYPIMHGNMFIQISLLVFITGIISAIYPARKALKMNAVDALRN